VTARRADLWGLCALAALVYVGLFPIYDQVGISHEQVLRNRAFVEPASIALALEGYPKSRAPLYALALRAWVRELGLPAKGLNLMLFCGVLLWTGVTLRRSLGISAWLPLMFCAFTGAHYLNVHSTVSETLFVAFATAVFSATLAYRKRPDRLRLALLVLACTGAFATRYFAAFWLIPLAALHVVTSLGPGLRQRILRAAAVATVPLAVLSPWLIYAYRSTGHWTGMRRAGRERLGEWAEFITPLGNLQCIAKTLYLDFFSPVVYGDARFVLGLPLGRWHDAVWALLGLAAVVAAASAIPRLRADLSQRTREEWHDWLASPRSLVLQYTALYLLVLFGVWSLSNIDPLHTRYLFPSYVFVVLAAFVGWQSLRPRLPSAAWRTPFYLGLAGLFLASGSRHAVFLGWLSRSWF
jgi:4-amino-4-deoxy-L-arabinose transferase-like glycosyltransferase